MSRFGGVFIALLLTASTAAASDDVHEYGRATVGYDGESLQVVATYDYAQTNHDGEWLVFQIGVTTDKAQWLRPRDLEMVTPDGRVVAAPTQRAVSRNVRSLYPAVQWISAFGTETLTQLAGCIPVAELSTGGLADYGCEDVDLWVIFRGQTTDHVAINDRRMARMFVFFQSPDGWPPGEYTFVLNGKDDTARLPVRLH